MRFLTVSELSSFERLLFHVANLTQLWWVLAC